jgi:formiminotetrahydrofolate cyclodeaminase
VAKVARASYGEWSDAGGAAAQADALRRRLAALALATAGAHEHALSALASPAGDPELAGALARAAEAPAAVAAAAADVAELAEEVARAGTGGLRPDAVAAAALAGGASRAAAHLVRVNLTAHTGDPCLAGARKAATRAERAADRALEGPA